jgi:hypothetical protein
MIWRQQVETACIQYTLGIQRDSALSLGGLAYLDIDAFLSPAYNISLPRTIILYISDVNCS